jgi:hypothetical protein
MENEEKKRGHPEPIIYLDKLCGLLIAFSLGYVLAGHFPMNPLIPWAVLGIAVLVKVVLASL